MSSTFVRSRNCVLGSCFWMRNRESQIEGVLHFSAAGAHFIFRGAIFGLRRARGETGRVGPEIYLASFHADEGLAQTRANRDHKRTGRAALGRSGQGVY